MNYDEAEILLHGLVDNEVDLNRPIVSKRMSETVRAVRRARLHRALRETMASADCGLEAPPGCARASRRLPASADARLPAHTVKACIRVGPLQQRRRCS